jgi:hypothetical protein
MLLGLDQASTALLGAIIGASAGLLGGFLTGWRQSKLEREKWLRAREDAVLADTRAVLGDLTKTLASAAHSMMWSTYKAVNSAQIGREELLAYELEYHEAVADMVKSQMHISTLDRALYKRITPLVSETIALGGDTFLALTAAVEGSANEETLVDFNRQALNLIKRIPTDLANLLRTLK